jgi:hypothetical protein
MSAANASLPTLLEGLAELGADRIAHSRRSLAEHLAGTGAILRAWESEPDVCTAGMFHSVYGTNEFEATCVDDRDRLRRLIGERAEALVRLFHVSNRPYGLLHASRLRDRFTGQGLEVCPSDLEALLEIECANLIEQRAGHRFLAELVQGGQGDGPALRPRVAADVRAFLDHLTEFHVSPPTGKGSALNTATVPHLDDAAASFEQHGYAVIRNLLSRRFLDVALRYYLSYLKVPGYYTFGDDNHALNRYADALGEAFIPEVMPQIERRTGRKLVPTYSFARIYTTESRLDKHVDRESCEISATLTVGFKTDGGLWPIHLECAGNDVAIELDVGDALVYRGADLPHWREPLESGFWCQLFFHFVDADGEFAAQRFDGRSRLGPVSPPVAA